MVAPCHTFQDILHVMRFSGDSRMVEPELTPAAGIALAFFPKGRQTTPQRTKRNRRLQLIGASCLRLALLTLHWDRLERRRRLRLQLEREMERWRRICAGPGTRSGSGSGSGLGAAATGSELEAAATADPRVAPAATAEQQIGAGTADAWAHACPGADARLFALMCGGAITAWDVERATSLIAAHLHVRVGPEEAAAVEAGGAARSREAGTADGNEANSEAALENMPPFQSAYTAHDFLCMLLPAPPPAQAAAGPPAQQAAQGGGAAAAAPINPQALYGPVRRMARFLLQLSLLCPAAAALPPAHVAAAALSLARETAGLAPWPPAAVGVNAAHGSVWALPLSLETHLGPARRALAAAQAGLEAPALRWLWAWAVGVAAAAEGVEVEAPAAAAEAGAAVPAAAAAEGVAPVVAGEAGAVAAEGAAAEPAGFGPQAPAPAAGEQGVAAAEAWRRVHGIVRQRGPLPGIAL